jgi:rhamnose transport system permease protein
MTVAIKRYLRPDQVRELSLVFLIGLVFLFFGTQIENYFSPRIINRIAADVAIIAVVAIGEALVLLTRNYDLSVGSVVGFTAYFTGMAVAGNPDIAPPLAVVLAIGMGATMGAINGVIVAWGKVPSIIVTFGTLAIFRALLVELSGAKTVTTASMPQWVIDLPQVTLASVAGFDIRPMVLVALGVVVIFALITRYLPFGRRLYAIGSNPEAARMGGLPASRMVFIAYVICGALAGLGGFMFLVRFGNLTVVAAQGLEIQVIAAAVVGGISTNGGSGTMIGVLLGAFLINLLQQSLLRWLQISEFWVGAFLGMLILVAVTIDYVLMNRLRSWWGHTGQNMDTDDDGDVTGVDDSTDIDEVIGVDGGPPGDVDAAGTTHLDPGGGDFDPVVDGPATDGGGDDVR